MTSMAWKHGIASEDDGNVSGSVSSRLVDVATLNAGWCLWTLVEPPTLGMRVEDKKRNNLVIKSVLFFVLLHELV